MSLHAAVALIGHLINRVTAVNYGCSSLRRGMPECNNCDAFVTEAYVRVFSPPDHDTVRVCPNCEDLIRAGSETRAPR